MFWFFALCYESTSFQAASNKSSLIGAPAYQFWKKKSKSCISNAQKKY